MSRPTYIQIEQGERELTITEAEKLAAIFSISLEDFLAGKAPEYRVVLEGRSKKSAGLQIRVTKKNLEKLNIKNITYDILDQIKIENNRKYSLNV